MSFRQKVEEILEPIFTSMDDDIAWARWQDETEEKLLSLVKEEVGEMKKLHTHDGIPSYTAGLEEGCVICQRNQALNDVLEHLT